MTVRASEQPKSPSNLMESKVTVQQRPVTFEAMQWTGSNTNEVAAWVQEVVEVLQIYNPRDQKTSEADGPFLKIKSADHIIHLGEWILQDGYVFRVLSNDDFWSEFVVS